MYIVQFLYNFVSIVVAN